MTEVMDKVQAFLRAHTGENSSGPWLVACSGGPDSVALADALRELGHSIALAHVNYGLRGADSEADARFVASLAQRWQAPFYLKTVDFAHHETSSSTQMRAREIRYDFFEDLMDTHGYPLCTTGHQADDQAETLLLSLLRSQEAALWHGIPPRRDRYLRPLIHCTRTEVMAHLQKRGLSYRVDGSNAQADYLRNQVRLHVLPALAPLHPDAGTQLRSRYEWYQQQHRFLQAMLAEYLAADTTALDWQPFVARFGQSHLPLLVAEALARWGLSGNWQQQAIRLIDSEVGHYLDTPYGRLWRTRSGLALQSASDTPAPRTVPRAELPQDLTWGPWRVQLGCPWTEPPVFGRENEFYLDADRVEWPLTLRPWQQGDRMQPLGLRGSKLLSDIFVDEKYPPQAKARALVLADQQGAIALSGFRIADRVKITVRTQSVLRCGLSRE